LNQSRDLLEVQPVPASSSSLPPAAVTPIALAVSAWHVNDADRAVGVLPGNELRAAITECLQVQAAAQLPGVGIGEIGPGLAAECGERVRAAAIHGHQPQPAARPLRCCVQLARTVPALQYRTGEHPATQPHGPAARERMPLVSFRPALSDQMSCEPFGEGEPSPVRTRPHRGQRLAATAGPAPGRLRHMRIALFATCLADTLFPDVPRATVTVLERLGHRVDFPQQQTCCGQMHVNTGYQREALPLIRHYVDTFEQHEVIVAPSGSCVGSISHQHAMVARRLGDERLAARAEAVADRTFELSQLLIDVLGVDDVGAAYPHRVTYHPTCHSLRMLRVGDRPLRLLRNVAGIDLVPLPDADVCCGFGGTFALKNADTSTAMLADKMRNVLATGAEVCTAGDASCLMHIGGGLSRLRAGVRTVHLAEILAATEKERPGGQRRRGQRPGGQRR
jgi:L-lactate dehydrogenase complex protein LldE